MRSLERVWRLQAPRTRQHKQELHRPWRVHVPRAWSALQSVQEFVVVEIARFSSI